MNAKIQKKLRIISGDPVSNNFNPESILASSEYGDDGIIPHVMKKWLGRTDPASTYATETS